jgi:uncharacterized protein (TIGR04255 family)
MHRWLPDLQSPFSERSAKGVKLTKIFNIRAHKHMSDLKSDGLPNYLTPPIDEVACGCRFTPLDRMKLPHFGVFWNRFKSDFPTVEHTVPLGDEGELATCDPATGLPLPRVWFIDASESQLIQLQTDRIYFNWRKREAAPVYPRYPSVVKNFADRYRMLGELAAEYGLGPLEPKVLDLSYINVFSRGDTWNELEDLRAIFPTFSWNQSPNSFLPSPHGLAFQAEYSLPDGQGKLSVKLTPGKRRADNAEVYSFNLSAKGIGNDTSEAGMREWFDMARTCIVKGFSDLTDLEIQNNTWRRQ